MPNSRGYAAGKQLEDTITADILATELRNQIKSAGSAFQVQSFPKFQIRIAGKTQLSKPDLEIANGGVHILSAKIGESKVFEAYRTATEYKAELPFAVEMKDRQLGEVFALTYPQKKGELYHLYILPREGRHRESLPQTSESIQDIAKLILDAVGGKFDELAKRAEPTVAAARRILYYGALELADAMKNVKERELESVFGGHDFFKSVLESQLNDKERRQALRTGPAFLFVNQVMFYVLLSEAEKKAGTDIYPEIKEEHSSQPIILQNEYFNRVRSRNYEPIYGIDVSHLFKGKRAENACRGIVQTIQGLAPSLDSPDLVGQVFQTLIPLQIRKPLGAHYTNPKAAAFLAGLAIENPDVKVLDPACGSGTLLVAAYRCKLKLLDLSRSQHVKKVHRDFVERDITGLDAMAFSAHLAAVNLALQSPLQDTEHVRIATYDSTRQYPGKSPQDLPLPWDTKQATLFEKPKLPKQISKIKGPVKVSDSNVVPFILDKVDLVIMNPPFTSHDNMTPSYRDGLRHLFSSERSAYRDAIHWKTSQQTFFLLLADRFLKKGGHIASVLPLTTFTSVTSGAFAPLVKFFLDNYTIKYIIVGLGRCSFSEDTSLTECLLVANKTKPSEKSVFHLIGTIEPPEKWSDIDVESMIRACKDDSYQENMVHEKYLQSALRPENETLSGLIFRLLPEFREALESISEIKKRSKIPFTRISDLIDKGLRSKRWILGGGYLEGYAPQALFVLRNANRAIRKVDRLVLRSEERNVINVKDKQVGPVISLNRNDLYPALRRITHLSKFDVTGNTDFVVSKPNNTIKKLVISHYGIAEGEIRWKRITEGGENTIGPWQDLITRGSSNVALAGRLDVSAPGTTFICCRSSNPFFLAAYGFTVTGFKSTVQEKLFCLWINSSFALLKLVEKTTITRGAWMRLEQALFKQISLPDSDALSSVQEREVERIYDQFSNLEFPSLKEQLATVGGPREKLDRAILSLLGISEEDALRLSKSVEAGVLAAINALLTTMTKN